MEIGLSVIWILLAMSVIAVTTLSMLPGRSWALRVCDFPRAQVLTLGLILVVISMLSLTFGQDLLTQPWRVAGLVLSVLLFVCIIIQGIWAVRLTPLVSPEVPRSELPIPCYHKRHPELPNEMTLRLITANIDFQNTNRGAAMEYLCHWRPHVLALIEPDEHWDEHIEHYRDSFPYITKEIRALGRGMVLLSRLPIEHAEVRCLVDEDRPSIWAVIELPGGARVRLVVTHPTPPGLPKRNKDGRHSSAKRDIELDIIAGKVRVHPNQHWILSGDFNDVGWSATTMRAKRVSGLRDPRVGRGMFSTFPASFPFVRYPIDHVLVSESFRIVQLKRLADIGSDHLPLLADLELYQPLQRESDIDMHADQLIYSPCEGKTRAVRIPHRDESD